MIQYTVKKIPGDKNVDFNFLAISTMRLFCRIAIIYSFQKLTGIDVILFFFSYIE